MACCLCVVPHRVRFAGLPVTSPASPVAGSRGKRSSHGASVVREPRLALAAFVLELPVRFLPSNEAYYSSPIPTCIGFWMAARPKHAQRSRWKLSPGCPLPTRLPCAGWCQLWWLPWVALVRDDAGVLRWLQAGSSSTSDPSMTLTEIEDLASNLQRVVTGSRSVTTEETLRLHAALDLDSGVLTKLIASDSKPGDNAHAAAPAVPSARVRAVVNDAVEVRHAPSLAMVSPAPTL